MTTVYRRCQGYCEQVLSGLQRVGAVGCKVGRSCQVFRLLCFVLLCPLSDGGAWCCSLGVLTTTRPLVAVYRPWPGALDDIQTVGGCIDHGQARQTTTRPLYRPWPGARRPRSLTMPFAVGKQLKLYANFLSLGTKRSALPPTGRRPEV